MTETGKAVQDAVHQEDPYTLANVASLEEIERLKAAEELFERRYQRKRRTSRVGIASQALVGYVALCGFFVNAYQSCSNKQQQERQRESDQARWEKEFERAQQADKYRAFFETSVLATDNANADKRLVGYALLEEFVDDRAYNSKATLMLEESLLQELRGHGGSGLDEAHQNAIEAILIALSHTKDCHSLQRAAQTIDKVARHQNAENARSEEGEEVFDLYVRRLIGRAILVCGNLRDFQAVREPLASTLLKSPGLAGMKGKPTPAEVNERIALLLHATCADELAISGTTDCPDILKQYDAKLCTKLSPSDAALENRACLLIKNASAKVAATGTPP